MCVEPLAVSRHTMEGRQTSDTRPPMEAIFRKELPPDNRRRAELCYGKQVLARWSQVLYGAATGW